MNEQREKEPWEEGRDFISPSRPFGCPQARIRRYRPPWRLWAAALFFGLVYLVLQAWVPVPENLRQAIAHYLTSPAADWTPRLAQYFSLDAFERRGYSLATEGQSKLEAPVLAPAAPSRDTAAPTVEPVGAEAAPAGFTAPVEGKVLRPFGRTLSPVDGTETFHPGLDLATTAGQRVRASLPGRVLAITNQGLLFTVRLSHEGGLQTVYSRLSSLRVSVGQQVGAGQELGASPGGWLHFAVEYNGQPIDPGGWL